MTEQLVGASVLPLMVDPLHGTLYFLLAKERYHPSWPDGSNLWTDFGGRQEPGEAAEDVAAREFVEESMGQIRFFDTDQGTRTAWGDVVHALKEGHYVLQFTHVHQGTRFVTFVVQVPWDPGAPARFTSARSAYLAQAGGISQEDCRLEKSHLGLFSVFQVTAASKNRGYLLSSERCSSLLTEALSIVLPELQFHFPQLF